MVSETYQPHETSASPSGDSITAIGSAVLHEVGPAAQSFYGAKDHFMGKAFGQDGAAEYRLIVTQPRDATGEQANHTKGKGETAEDALLDALEGMRTLESVAGPALARLPMNGQQEVAFTALEHYAPKIAPSEQAHPIPEYLSTQMQDDTLSARTYDNTIKQEGWQQSLTTMLDTYLTHDTQGRALAQSLEISSLQALTPEQAVKLSLSFVQDVSKYSYRETYRNRRTTELTTSDQSTTMELLSQGMEHKDDPDWEGNGVCRNVASNVKSVFEALKSNQSELSMLRNTYCIIEGSKAFNNKREDIMKMEMEGHAWNKFVTIDGKGSSTITITDATWALSEKPAEALQHMDYTLPRAAVDVTDLAMSSEQPPEAFRALEEYYGKMLADQTTTRVVTEQQLGSIQQLEKFALTEYLKAARHALPSLAESGATGKAPDYVINTLYDIAAELEPREVQTAFDLEKLGWIPKGVLSEVLNGYVTGDNRQLPQHVRTNRLLTANDELQSQIFARLGRGQLLTMAETDGRFRERVRSLQPNLLPAFDPEQSAADKRELQYLAERIRVHQNGDPRYVIADVKRTLKKLAPSEAAYDQATQELDDYTLVRQASAIQRQWSQARASRVTAA